jgi:hypothetical protein
MSREEAYAEALHRIHRVKDAGTTSLDLSGAYSTAQRGSTRRVGVSHRRMISVDDIVAHQTVWQSISTAKTQSAESGWTRLWMHRKIQLSAFMAFAW